MITNRDEVLENALRVFAKLNYEKASQTEIAKACGLSKAGLLYYFPFKKDLFVAVVDKYVFDSQRPENKYQFSPFHSLPEFIGQYIAGVKKTMQQLINLLDDGYNPGKCSFNLYYFHLLTQVRLYYPDVEEKVKSCLKWDYQLWFTAIQQAREKGEIRKDLEVEQTASMFHHVFWGLSFEEAFSQGLDTEELLQKLHFLYSLIKA